MSYQTDAVVFWGFPLAEKLYDPVDVGAARIDIFGCDSDSTHRGNPSAMEGRTRGANADAELGTRVDTALIG